MKKSTRRKSRTPSPRKTISKRSTLKTMILPAAIAMGAMGLGLYKLRENSKKEENKKLMAEYYVKLITKAYSKHKKMSERMQELIEELSKDFDELSQITLINEYLKYTQDYGYIYNLIYTSCSYTDGYPSLSNQILKIYKNAHDENEEIYNLITTLDKLKFNKLKQE